MKEKSKEKNYIKIIFFNIKKIFIGNIIIFILSVLLLKIKFHLNVIFSLIISGLVIYAIIEYLKKILKKEIEKAGYVEEWHDFMMTKLQIILILKMI